MALNKLCSAYQSSCEHAQNLNFRQKCLSWKLQHISRQSQKSWSVHLILQYGSNREFEMNSNCLPQKSKQQSPKVANSLVWRSTVHSCTMQFWLDKVFLNFFLYSCHVFSVLFSTGFCSGELHCNLSTPAILLSKVVVWFVTSSSCSQND